MTARISREVISKIRALRQIHRVSAQELADRVTALGYPVSRAVVANWESRRKATIPVDFLVLAAQALDTTPSDILDKPVSCPTCKGEPPRGYTCNTCGESDEAVDALLDQRIAAALEQKPTA